MLFTTTTECKYSASLTDLETTTLWLVTSAVAVTYTWSADQEALLSFDPLMSVLICGRVASVMVRPYGLRENNLDVSINKQNAQEKVDSKIFNNSKPHAYV